MQRSTTTSAIGFARAALFGCGLLSVALGCSGTGPASEPAASAEPSAPEALDQSKGALKAPAEGAPADGEPVALDQSAAAATPAAVTPAAAQVVPTQQQAAPPVQAEAESAPDAEPLDPKFAIGETRATAEVTWLTLPDGKSAISSTEVTVAQYKACVEAGDCGEDTFKPGKSPGPCNYGLDDRASHPMNCVSFHGAEAMCTSVGGRICGFKEWLGACSGADGRAFPYGDEFEQAACHTASRKNTIEGRPKGTLEVGSIGTCEGGVPGLYDMAGNVMEWVDGCKGTYCKFLGGAYLGNDPLDLFNSCKGPCGGNQKTFQSATVGIRCCKDLDG